MIKILKYLKPHMKAVVVIVALLIIQVYCDLSLPQYTSNIVDIGIQQGGIENAAPSHISGDSLEKLKLFISDSDIKKVNKAYKLDKDSQLKSQEVYTFEGNKEDDESISEIFKTPMVMVYMANKSDKFDLDQIQMAIESGMMTKEQLLTEAQKNMEKYGNFSDSLINQAAVEFVKGEYEDLGIDLNKIQMDYLWKVGFQMIGFTLIMILAAIAAGYVASKTGATIGRDTRKNIFKKVLSFSNTEMDKFSTASLITRSTNDIQQIQVVIVILLRMVMMAPIMGIGACIKVAATRTGMGWIVFAGVGIILIVMAVLIVIAMPKFKAMQKLIDKVNLISREIITGIPVIRAFSRERHEEGRFQVANMDLTKTQIFTHRTMAFMMPAMMLIMNGITLVIVWFGAKGVDLGNLQVGDMMAFITYAMMIVMSFMMLTVAAIMLPRAGVAAERISEVMATETSVGDLPETKKLEDPRGVVRFKDVCFRYPNAADDVLREINFTAEPGKTTAIIGSTGCGKTTLVNLIPRFFDATEGAITIDGIDVREMSQHQLRSLIGYVPQKGVLFSGDIRSNIKYASDDISDEKMKEAAEIAQAIEFIDEKEDGYESSIAQGGTNVSGGQKQRLSIARAIAKEPKIFIFDDSFSALDYKTDGKLRRELGKKTDNASVIIVAQRIATILNADKILVLDEGEIVGEGTHQELLRTCETYREIASSQLSEEELGKGAM